jgi:hypothetical protein
MLENIHVCTYFLDLNPPIRYVCCLVFTDEDDKPGRENIEHVSTLMCKADHLIRDGEFHNTSIHCDKLQIIICTK